MTSRSTGLCRRFALPARAKAAWIGGASRLLAALMLLGIASGANAAACNSPVGAGPFLWSAIGTWSCGHVPLNTDDVTIVNDSVVTVNIPGAVAGSLTIAGGAIRSTLRIVAAANALNVTNSGGLSGTVTINAPTALVTKQIAVGPGTLTVTSAGAVTLCGTGAVTICGGTTTPGAANLSELSATSGTITINGALAITAGNFQSIARVTVATGRINVTGNALVTGGGASNQTAVLRATAAPAVGGIGINIVGDLSVASTVATSSSVTLAAGSVINVTGDVSNGDLISVGAGTFNATGATKTFTTTSNTNVSSTTVGAGGQLVIAGNVVVTAGPIDNASARVSVTTGSITINGDATVRGSASAAGGLRTATLLVSGAPAGGGTGLTINGNLNILSHAITPTAQTAFAQISAAGGVINVAGNVNNGDTILVDAGIFTVTGAGSTFANSNAATAAWTRVTSGLLDISGNTGTLTNAANELMTVTLAAGRITVGNTTTHTGTLNNNGTITLSSTSTVNANGSFTNSGTFTNSAGGQLFLRGATSTVNGTFTRGTGTVTMAGVAAQTISGTALSLNNFTVTNTNGVALNSNAIVTAAGILNGILTMNGVGTVLTPAAAVVVSGTGTLTGTGTVQVTRTMATADFASQYTIATKTLTNLTVEYIATATQAVNALTYGSGTGGGLKISNTSATGATVAAAGVVVNGTLTMNGTTSLLNPVATAIVSGTGTLTGTGTVQVTRTAATADFVSQYTMTTKTLTNLTVEYVGAAAQIVNALTYGSGTGGGLKINNATGVTLAGDATAGGLLSLTSGVVTTGAAITLISSADCPGSVARNSGHVAGNLRLRVPGAGSVTCIFHIGDAAGYRPLSVAFTTLSAAGDVTAAVSQANGDTTNIGTSSFEPLLTVNRFWTLANTTTNFASAIATFSWLAGDVDTGADPLAFVVGRFSGGWTYLTTLPASLSAQATGLSAATLAGEFAIGETVMTLYSHWRMDQSAWNGTADEVVDSGTGANHGTASTCQFVGCAGSGAAPPKPTTSSASPALVSGPNGTCSYGVFNRANKDHVALPGTYPNLMSAAGGFTITAWIRTTDNTQAGQRIMIDDENNASPGGWGFSVGDSGNAGTLRFYYRQPTVFTLDTTNVISNNTWYFVAASISLAAGVNASRVTLYAFDTTGTQLTSVTNTFTWTAGTDAGPPSIGGETNASGENSAAFGFAGNIDEVRVYRSALSALQIDRFKLETRVCPIVSFNHIRIEHGGIGLTCTPATMTVKACLDDLCSSTYGGSVTATLSPTGWVGGDSVTFTGSTTKDLRITTAGPPVALGAGAITPAPAVATRCFNGATETCAFEFKTAGFIFDVPDLTACKPSTSVTITAVRADLTSQACVPAFESGTRSVNFWTTYSSPATGSLQAEVNGTPVGTSFAGIIPSTPINLAFAAGAVSSFTVRYPDAGQMQLNARYTGSGSETDLVMDGVDSFVSAPVGLAVIPSGGACVAGDATCAVYKKAGETFSHDVKAYCWEVDGDTDLTTGNALTPNFQMANIPLSANLVAPSPGSNASLGATTVTFVGGTSGDGGIKTVSQTVSEVGVFTISATPAVNAYLGIITVPGGTSPNIGRFRPDHFTVTGAGTLAQACSTFTYLGQRFGISGVALEARNAANNLTQNYTGSFAIHTPSSVGSWSLAARDTTGAGTALTVDTGAASVTGAWSSGSLTAAFVDLAISRSTIAPAGPFANARIGVAPTDTDGVALSVLDLDADGAGGDDHKQIGATTLFRYGRLRLQGATGMSRQHAAAPWLEMAVPARTEYWNGTAFTLNTDDSCTTLDRANIALGGYARLLDACETMVNRGAGATVTFASGIGALRLSTPGTGNEGSVLVTPQLGATVAPGNNSCAAVGGAGPAATPALKSYLQGAWTGAGWDQNPSARAAFGLYGTQPRNFIFFRENY